MHCTHTTIPTARNVVIYRLHVHHGWAVLPEPTREHGGITPAPAGVNAEVYIGAARDMDPHTAERLAVVLAECDVYDVIGEDMGGMILVTRALNAVLNPWEASA